MSDIAAVAAITGGTSVLTSGITAAITYAVSKNSAKVELAKVDAENERLRDTNREEERRNRQSTYQQCIDAFNLLFQNFGVATSEERVLQICGDYNHLLSAVLLFGPPSVRDGAYALNDVYGKIPVALAEQEEKEPEKPFEEMWIDATVPVKEEFANAGSTLVQLMHADVTRGITEDPDQPGN